MKVLARLGEASSPDSLGARFIDNLPLVIGADIIGVYVFDRDRNETSVFIKGASERVLLNYERCGRPVDVVLEAALRTRSPAHQGLLFSPADWHVHDLYRHAARAFPLEHYLVAPLLASGQVIGTLNLGRRAGCPPFDSQDVLTMSVLSGQVAATLLEVWQNARAPRLTARELEVVALVAKGLTNADIARLLGITADGVKQALKRMFSRLDVSSRAELVARWLSR